VSSRRRRGTSDEDVLNQLGHVQSDTEGQAESLTDFANAGYGSRVSEDVFPELSRSRVKVQLIDIDQIYPDFAQPRRVLPSAVRQYWSGSVDADAMNHLFSMWLKEAQLERSGRPLDLTSYLLGKETERAPGEWEESGSTGSSNLGICEGALLRVAILAASIRRDGLTNPITVIQKGSTYSIETGERRWLAFHLLRVHFATEANWRRIPARVMDQMSIWRQASENNVRADLNAIARARQLALIIMDLYQQQGVRFRPFEIYKHEQGFYAQVADPIQFKIPYGKGELVLNAMGFENKSTIKRYRDLLALPPEVWTRADDHNVPESVLRQLVGKPSDQMSAFMTTWLDTGRLYPQDQQNPWYGDRTRPQYGKFSRLLEYDLQQWLGEYDDLDEDSRGLVVKFLKDLLKTLGA